MSTNNADAINKIIILKRADDCTDEQWQDLQKKLDKLTILSDKIIKKNNSDSIVEKNILYFSTVFNGLKYPLLGFVIGSSIGLLAMSKSFHGSSLTNPFIRMIIGGSIGSTIGNIYSYHKLNHNNNL